jgi:hypothetical protein
VVEAHGAEFDEGDDTKTGDECDHVNTDDEHDDANTDDEANTRPMLENINDKYMIDYFISRNTRRINVHTPSIPVYWAH